MQGGDTIIAVASGTGTSGVAVIRVSGPAAEKVVTGLTRRPPPAARRLSLRRLYGADGELLDEALIAVFEAGASFTGEAAAEIHCHGGRAVVRAVLAAAAEAGPCRTAEPGEFTWRAFANGRMDLAGVEALGDLLAAETEAQHRQAARLMDGALHRAAEAWREDLLAALALIEVTIDWADEEVPEDVGPEVRARLSRVVAGLEDALRTSAGAQKLRTGFEVALIGAPNAGKSSLLNALAGREAAITSHRPGTTRDVVELRYDLLGLPITFLDTAGLRDTVDEVEAIGIARARDRAEMADIRLILSAPDAPAGPGVRVLERPGDIVVSTKRDLAPGDVQGVLCVSATTGEGLGDLLARVHAGLETRGGGGLVAHARQQTALADGLGALRSAIGGLDQRGAEEVSEDLRQALRHLEGLTGRIGTEDLLGAVFGRFCLGK